MKLLKDKLAFIGKGMKNTFLYFPVTQGSIWLFTLLCTILVSCSDSVVMDVGEKLMYFLIFYGTGSFFAEALYQKTESRGCVFPCISCLSFRQSFLHGCFR